jgi:hypothetical protein
MKKITLFLFLYMSTVSLVAQEPVRIEKTRFSAGLTVNPQTLFIGGFDAGGYISFEHQHKNRFGYLAGLELRNKWFHLPVSNTGLSTESINTQYNVTAMLFAGVGYTFKNKKRPEINSFNLTANPYFRAFKESVDHPFISNTVSSTMFSVNYGITWVTTRVTKKGRTWNTQFYLPVYGPFFLDEMRFMSLRFGFNI